MKRFIIALGFVCITLFVDFPSFASSIFMDGPTIQDEGSNLTHRPTMNFTGDSIACADNGGSSRTDCTVNLYTTPSNLYVAGHTFIGELNNFPASDAQWLTSGNCKLNGCLDFNNVDPDYVKITGYDSLAGGYSALSIEGWVYLASVAYGSSYSFIDKREYDNSPIIIAIRFSPTGAGNGGKIRVQSAYFDYITTNVIMSASAWIHVAFVYDGAQTCASGNRVKIYKDGVSQTLTQTSCTDTAMPTAVNDNPAYIGTTLYTSFPTGTTGFSGRMDEVAVWTKALSQSDVDSRYNSGTGAECSGSETSILYCYHFNETVGFLASQIVTASVSGLGNDSNNCTSTSTPCRTIQAAVNKIPSYYNNNSIITIAAGTYPEQVSIINKSPNGDFTISILGIITRVSNSFTNNYFISGTSSGTNTNNFPASTGTLFNDTTLSQFGAANTKDGWWLELTSGTGSGGVYV